MSIRNCFVSEEVVSQLQQFTVYKVLEGSIVGDYYFSTFAAEKLIYMLNRVTMAPLGERGISCFLNDKHAATTLMLSLRKNTDKLAVFKCIGYNEGDPPFEYPSKRNPWISKLVRAIMPISIVCLYTDIAGR